MGAGAGDVNVVFFLVRDVGFNDEMGESICGVANGELFLLVFLKPLFCLCPIGVDENKVVLFAFAEELVGFGD